MIETVVQAAKIELYRESHEPFDTPMKRQKALIVGGTHLLQLAKLFPRYAVSAQVLVPAQIPEVDAEVELRRAIQLEEITKNLCTGGGLVRDLSGIDTDSLDVLILCSQSPSIRDEFLAQAWRVVRELGRVLIFTSVEIPLTHLGSFGVAAPKYFPMEGFYAGVMRKAAAIRARN
jgi:hypothetical protein